MTTLAAERADAWRWRAAIFASTWLTYASFYLTRKSLSVATIGITEEPSFGLTTQAIGWIDGAYLAAYMAGMFVWGPAADRWGTRRVVGIGLVGCVACALIAGAAPERTLFAGAVIAAGLFQASGWGPLNKTMSAWFAREERGFALGAWCTSYAIGGLVASPFAALMAAQFGHWRYAFLVPSLTLLGIGALCLAVQRDRPEDVGLPPVEPDAPAEPATWASYRAVLSNRTVWLLGAVYFLLKPTRYAILFWGPKYLHDRLGTDVTDSAMLSALFELGGPLGIVALGLFSDRLLATRRFPAMILSLALLAPLLFFFDRLVGAGPWATGLTLFATGFLLFGPDALASSVAAIDFGRQRGAGTASGVVNGFGSLGAIAGGSIPGLVSERFGWEGVFVGLGLASLVAALLMLPSWNRVPQELADV